MQRGLTHDLDQIWNFVLSCVDCNRGAGGKFDLSPAPVYVERLARRNDYFIESNHPIKETLIHQTGRTEAQRSSFLQSKLTLSTQNLPGSWLAQPRGYSVL
jgi:hypothetical protein